MTLLAIYILENVYTSEASEAEMIIANAKTYCKNAGVRNPNAILKKFTFLLRPWENENLKTKKYSFSLKHKILNSPS